MKTLFVSINYRLCQFLFMLSLVMSGHLIGLNENTFRFGRGFFLLPTICAIFLAIAYRFWQNKEHTKAKNFFISAGITFVCVIPWICVLYIYLFLTDPALPKPRGFLFYAIIPFVAQMIIIINYIICGISTVRENKRLKDSRTSNT